MLMFLPHKNFDSFSTYRERILSLSTTATLSSGVVHGCTLKHHAAPPSVFSIFKEQTIYYGNKLKSHNQSFHLTARAAASELGVGHRGLTKMRYYVYISDSKVEMLYTQIPPKLLENIAGRLTNDLKFIKTEFSESPKEKSLESKLRIVENYLAEKNLIGTISEPKKYFKGICSMK